MDKVSVENAFLDVSDYARPAARWLARRLAPTPVTPIHLTLAYTVVGCAAGILFALHRWLPFAGGLLLLKSLLDAADGSLARARRHPSRVGRFLDSVCDFVVMAAVFGGIAFSAWSQTGQTFYWGLAAAALLCATLQGSVYSYYYVRYREETRGDQTSRVGESAPEGYTWDHPTLLRCLYALYRLIYGWQDALMIRIDHWAAPAGGVRLRPAFLTTVSVLGLGTQLAVIALCAAIGQPTWALWLFNTVFNFYWLALIAVRCLSGRLAPTHNSGAC